MKTSSKKAKGRRLQDWLHDLICDTFNLESEQVYKSIMSNRGVDVRIIGTAASIFPMAIECKNQEKFSAIYDDFAQATYNAKKEKRHSIDPPTARKKDPRKFKWVS